MSSTRTSPALHSFAQAVRAADIYQVVEKTPLQPAPCLSQSLGRQILIKREDLQPVFSFKSRGAANRIGELVRQGNTKGVAAASAGNHAQGVAISARHRGIPALIVMPQTTPDIKVAAVRNLGAEVVLHGDSYEEASQYLLETAKKRGMEVIQAFDDSAVICGQATVAMEMLDQHPGPLDAVFVPVGGGGLLAGMAAYIKEVRPKTLVIGVEPEDSACASAALAAGERITLTEVGLFTDGVAVRTVGEHTFPLIQKYCDEIITVSIDEICGGVRDLFEEFRVLAEPAGALATAGMRRWCATNDKGRVLAAVLSGANTNFERLGHIVERTTLSASQEMLLCVEIPERPGSFLGLCDDLGDCSVSEFNYRHSDDKKAEVLIGVRLLRADGAGDISAEQRLRDKGYRVKNLSHNNLAKDHIRFMVGGHSPGIRNEAVYAFMFPEKPGALKKFLQTLGSRWNITLFHYRNHGSAYGRVLAGFDLAASSPEVLERDLVRIGYRFEPQSDNPAYLSFLR